jgi:hypothetical protein
MSDACAAAAGLYDLQRRAEAALSVAAEDTHTAISF